ncbi:hypothetical protein ACQKMD_21660 [Viridibacillus sp. NPDC096237]|uniref:hypothetical protein n=1 Tax=Viridibacillus sp. NPDC096237 TaxID=3390721 RepID=UPI003D044E50
MKCHLVQQCVVPVKIQLQALYKGQFNGGIGSAVLPKGRMFPPISTAPRPSEYGY